MKKFDEVWRTTVSGALLGLGVPVGYLIYSYYLNDFSPYDFSSWAGLIVSQEWPVLFCLTVLTMLVFGLFGYYNGYQQKYLAYQKRQMEEFLHIAVHDIRSPLAVMKEGIALLREEMLGPISEHQKKVLNSLSTQSNVMADLITEILDIHRMETGHFNLSLEPVSIKDVIEKAVSEMTLLFEKKKARVNIHLRLPYDQRVRLDQFRIRQVIRNILNNAIKYIPINGLVEVGASLLPEGNVVIEVFNDGSTIPEDKIDCIFDKFVQMKKRDQKLGYGLGLSICKNIVDLHGGKIWAENKAPFGVSFKISLPERLVLKVQSQPRDLTPQTPTLEFVG